MNRIDSRATPWIHLNLIRSLTPRKLQSLLDAVHTPDAVLSLSASELVDLGCSPSAATKIVSERDLADPGAEIRRAAETDLSLLWRGSSTYPAALLELVDPPPVLYVRGRMPASIGVAIVGSRRCSAYGRSQAHRFADAVATAGACVVSGLAEGIDGAAHRGALNAGGETLAVLGSGPDVLYPRCHFSLASEIASDGGGIVTEFPCGTSPTRYTFPRRNRLISVLSRGVLVVEAAKKSGSLITVDFALEQGRDVYCLPGCVTSPLSVGTHRLIRDGATLVSDPEELVTGLGLDPVAAPAEDLAPEDGDIDEESRPLVTLLRARPSRLGEIAELLERSPEWVAATVGRLEVRGWVKKGLEGKYAWAGAEKKGSRGNPRN